MGNLEDDVNRRLAAAEQEKRRSADEDAAERALHNTWLEGTARPLMREFVALMKKHSIPAVRYRVSDPKRLGSRDSDTLGWQDNRIGHAMITVDADWVPTHGAVTWHRMPWPLRDRYEVVPGVPPRKFDYTPTRDSWEEWTFEEWLQDFAGRAIEEGTGDLR